MISVGIRRQLIAFVVVTAVTMITMFVYYMRGPASLGIGVYHVTLRMPASGGLYPDAEVTYRGVPVGLVESMSADASGATAILRLNDGTAIPADLQANVRSTSAIGEQYLNLVPRAGAQPSALRDGSIIGASAVSLPTTTTEVLGSVEQLMKSVNSRDLNTTVNELAQAFGTTNDDLGHLLDSASSFQQAASQNLTPTMTLLDKLQGVLAVEAGSAPQIVSAWAHLNTVTTRASSVDPALRNLINAAPSTLAQVSVLTQTLRQFLPGELAGTETIANVLNVYTKYVEHILIEYPAVVAAYQSAIPPSLANQAMPKVRLAFKANINNPAACTTGYAEAGHERDANDLSPKPYDVGNYCKVAHSDPRVVRGARNLPCPNSSKRAATPALCGLNFPLFRATGSAFAARIVVDFFEPTTDALPTAWPTSLAALLMPLIPES